MKKLKIAAALAAVTVLLAGCGSQPTQSQSKYDFTMPDPPAQFVVKTVDDAEDSTMKYAAIEFDGKIYVKYGTLQSDLDASEVGSCLGYLVQDGNEIKEIGVFTLTSDPDRNYLVTLDNAGVMENPSFFRNSETVGKDISTPSFIVSENYNYWK